MNAALRYALAFAIAIALLAHVSGYREFNGAILFVLLGLTMGLGILLGKLGLNPAGHGVKRQKLLTWAALSLMGGIAIMQALKPDNTSFQRAGELIVRGRVGPDTRSKGTEIWARVESVDGTSSLAPQAMGEGWRKADDGTVVWTGTVPSAARWQVPYDQGIQLRLTRHYWSGTAEIEWLDRKQTVELYSPEGGGAVLVSLSGRPVPTQRDRLLGTVIRIADMVVVSWLLLALMLFVRSRVARGR